MKNRHLASIQALRGIAALLVLFFHMNAISCAPEENCNQWLITKIWEEGYWGVDLFFVISGFVMMYSTKHINRGLLPAAKFILTRTFRIFSLWWIYAAIMGLYFLTTYGIPAPPDRIGSQESLIYFVNSMLLIPQGHAPVLGVGWTLVHEIGFYVLFAISLLVRFKFAILIFFMWALIICCNIANQHTGFMANGYFELYSSPFGIEFLIGIGVGIYYNRTREPRKYSLPIFLFTTLTLLITMIYGIDQTSGNFELKRSLIYGGLSGLLVCSTLGFEEKIRFYKALKMIGDWSFSLYLSHMIVLLIIRRVWQGLDAHLPDIFKFNSFYWLDDALFWVIGIVSCILFSRLSYRHIERPIYFRFRKKLESSALSN